MVARDSVKKENCSRIKTYVEITFLSREIVTEEIPRARTIPTFVFQYDAETKFTMLLLSSFY